MVSYATEIARLSDSSIGVLYYSMRRSGKTVYGISDGYWDTTENNESVFPIQSKTAPDAKKVFKKLVDSWKRLPKYWRPEDGGATEVKSSLEFSERRRITKIGEKREYREVLNSTIYFVSSSETANDGDRTTYQVTDEIGKVDPPLDVNERHNINKECVLRGTTILGFIYAASTIEDFEKFAAEEAQTLWNRSDSRKRLPDGFTDSGLFRIFLPASIGLEGTDVNGQPFVDEWGYSDIKSTKAHILSMYQAKKGKDQLSYRRKYPLTIDDSFALASGGNNYSKERLMSQMKYNTESSPSPWIRGNFTWLNGVRDTEVIWQPDPEGRWMAGWFPKQEDRESKRLP